MSSGRLGLGSEGGGIAGGGVLGEGVLGESVLVELEHLARLLRGRGRVGVRVS